MPPTSFLARLHQKNTRQPTFPSSDLVKPTKTNKRTLLYPRRPSPCPTIPFPPCVRVCFCSILCLFITVHITQDRTGPPRQFKLALSGTIYISILHVPPSPLFASQLYSLFSLFSFFLLLLPIYTSPTTSSSSSLSFVAHVIPRGQFCGLLDYHRLTAHHGQSIQTTDKRLAKPPP